jgi:hypothetical protein
VGWNVGLSPWIRAFLHRNQQHSLSRRQVAMGSPAGPVLSFGGAGTSSTRSCWTIVASMADALRIGVATRVLVTVREVRSALRR